MGRRKKLLSLIGAKNLASLVVERFVQKVPSKLGQMTSNYQAGINDYIMDTNAQRFAEYKLSVWYSSLAKRRGRIAGIYKEIKEDYLNSLYPTVEMVPARERVPVPTR